MTLTTLLTPRQRQVAILKANGYTARQIATQLNIDKTTVNQHLGRIYRRTRSRDQVHAIAVLMAMGEISTSDIEILGWRKDIAA